MGIYRSASRWSREEAEAEAAHEILTNHIADPENGCCTICLAPGPCGPANAAANRLVDLGRPVLLPESRRDRRAGWRGWFGSTGAVPATGSTRWRRAPLLTFAWLLRLGVIS